MPLIEYPVRKARRPAFPPPRPPKKGEANRGEDPDRLKTPAPPPPPPPPATQVPPVGEPGQGGPKRSQRSEGERGVGRVPYGLLPRSDVESVEDERRGPGSDRHVRKDRVQWRLEPYAVEHVARRRTARGDSLLHLRLNVLGDIVQEG